MRTTVTLDPDVEQAIKRRMRERGQTFRDALNEAVREGVRAWRPAIGTRVHHMGEPSVSLDRALRLAGDVEDHALVDRMGSGA